MCRGNKGMSGLRRADQNPDRVVALPIIDEHFTILVSWLPTCGSAVIIRSHFRLKGSFFVAVHFDANYK